MCDVGTSRWFNYYVHWLLWSTSHAPHIDGIYYDGINFDRRSMQRVRKVLDTGAGSRGTPLIDIHTGTGGPRKPAATRRASNLTRANLTSSSSTPSSSAAAAPSSTTILRARCVSAASATVTAPASPSSSAAASAAAAAAAAATCSAERVHGVGRAHGGCSHRADGCTPPKPAVAASADLELEYDGCARVLRRCERGRINRPGMENLLGFRVSKS